MKNLNKFMLEWRAIRDPNGKIINQAEYDLVLSAIDGKWKPTDVAPTPVRSSGSKEPIWISTARNLIGTKEIPGPKHNSWIAQGWARLGAGWFNDDETPWCGFFVAHCMNAVGLDYPSKGMFARAKEWLKWGKACKPQLGAVVVFGRNGGGHVGFLVGQSATNFYVLGGNQGNMVSITPIAKNRALGYRWPLAKSIENIPLPTMTGGTVSTNEA